MQETTYAKLCVYGRIMKLLKPVSRHQETGGGNVNMMTVMGDA